MKKYLKTLFLTLILFVSFAAILNSPSIRADHLQLISVADTYISAMNGDTNYGNETILRLAQAGSPFSTMRALIKFDLSGAPSSIESATLQLYCEGADDWWTILIYQIISDWDENTVTWNTQPAISYVVVCRVTIAPSEGWYSADVTPIVKGWVNGTFANYGFYLQLQNETGTGDMTIRSREYPEPGYEPQLLITYGGTTTTTFTTSTQPLTTTTTETTIPTTTITETTTQTTTLTTTTTTFSDTRIFTSDYHVTGVEVWDGVNYTFIGASLYIDPGASLTIRNSIVWMMTPNQISNVFNKGQLRMENNRVSMGLDLQGNTQGNVFITDTHPDSNSRFYGGKYYYPSFWLFFEFSQYMTTINNFNKGCFTTDAGFNTTIWGDPTQNVMAKRSTISGVYLRFRHLSHSISRSTIEGIDISPPSDAVVNIDGSLIDVARVGDGGINLLSGSTINFLSIYPQSNLVINGFTKDLVGLGYDFSAEWGMTKPRIISQAGASVGAIYINIQSGLSATISQSRDLRLGVDGSTQITNSTIALFIGGVGTAQVVDSMIWGYIDIYNDLNIINLPIGSTEPINGQITSRFSFDRTVIESFTLHIYNNAQVNVLNSNIDADVKSGKFTRQWDTTINVFDSRSGERLNGVSLLIVDCKGNSYSRIVNGILVEPLTEEVIETGNKLQYFPPYTLWANKEGYNTARAEISHFSNPIVNIYLTPIMTYTQTATSFITTTRTIVTTYTTTSGGATYTITTTYTTTGQAGYPYTTTRTIQSVTTSRTTVTTTTTSTSRTTTSTTQYISLTYTQLRTTTSATTIVPPYVVIVRFQGLEQVDGEFFVDGQRQGVASSFWQYSLTFDQGTTHILSVTPVITTGDIRYVADFATVTVSGNAIITFNYKPQYLVKFDVEGIPNKSVVTLYLNRENHKVPYEAWFAKDSLIEFSIAPTNITGNEGTVYLFEKWKDDINVEIPSQTYIISPRNITAVYAPYHSVWLEEQGIPEGESVKVYVNGASYIVGSKVWVGYIKEGTTLTFAPSPEYEAITLSNGERIVYSGSIPPSPLVITEPTTIRILYGKQYLFTLITQHLPIPTKVSIGNRTYTVYDRKPLTLWFDQGLETGTIVISDIVYDGEGIMYQRTGWSDNATNPHPSITMDGPKTLVADYITYHQLTIKLQGTKGHRAIVEGIPVAIQENTTMWCLEGHIVVLKPQPITVIATPLYASWLVPDRYEIHMVLFQPETLTITYKPVNTLAFTIASLAFFIFNMILSIAILTGKSQINGVKLKNLTLYLIVLGGIFAIFWVVLEISGIFTLPGAPIVAFSWVFLTFVPLILALLSRKVPFRGIITVLYRGITALYRIVRSKIQGFSTKIAMVREMEIFAKKEGKTPMGNQVEAPREEKVEQGAVKTCHKCGAQLPIWATYCGKCGANLTEGERENELERSG